MIITFSWTWPAFVAGAKTVTRRDWSPNYVARWRKGTVFTAYNHPPRFLGRPIGTGRLTHDVIREPLAEMRDSDYEAEGFAWFHDHMNALPPGARRQAWAQGDCCCASFRDWANGGQPFYVIRYEILSVEAWAREELDRLMAGGSGGDD